MRINWLTKKVKTLFRVKDKFLHQACKICKDVCSWGESYIGETIRNVEVRWDEHNNPTKKWNPLKQNKGNLDHAFNWPVLANAPKNMFQRKVLEAHYIVLERGETFYSLLVTRYISLVTRYFLLVTRYIILVSRNFLLATFYSLLITFYSLLVTFYSLRVLFSRWCRFDCI